MSTTEYYDHIEHTGIVESIDLRNGIIKVRIDDSDECGDCPAARLCEAGGQASNLVSISSTHPSSYRKGDIVTLQGTEQMHKKAIMYATVLPCIAIIAVMIAVYLLTFNQLAAALSGVAVMVVFFCLLYAFRNKISHEFAFTIVGRPERAGHER